MLNNLLPQQWEHHTCIFFQQYEILLLYDVLIVAPSRMLPQQLSLDLHLKLAKNMFVNMSALIR